MTTTYDTVKTALTSHFNIPADTVRPESTLEDLGLDSLAVVELLCVLQDELGLRVPTGDDALKSLQLTLAEAAAVIEQAQAPAPAAETLA
ncbi:phosphopantetheine-binding protein [Streptomyces sp. RS10V-4]|uniref:acyl carrier protein n=1 Tax=Streptomyces rhizoryzae TaxID=2932493 RepID=UPI00200557D4|nr:phosphopantetheine-binding protein [Streptomyces rhizoryzae]MCK7622221.1 phosphopantetheine-binding protein [Streptomyces rhizoryzae]